MIMPWLAWACIDDPSKKLLHVCHDNACMHGPSERFMGTRHQRNKGPSLPLWRFGWAAGLLQDGHRDLSCRCFLQTFRRMKVPSVTPISSIAFFHPHRRN
jgi:hypothetical protein